VRPNIHIQDMIGVYSHFLEHQSDIESGNYNAGFENISILGIAEMIAKKVPAEIIITESNDPRSYRQNSDKLLGTNYIKQFSVQHAIDDIIEKYNSGDLEEKDEYFTVKTMKALNLQE